MRRAGLRTRGLVKLLPAIATLAVMIAIATVLGRVPA
jgi:hypothetical protein